MFPLKAMSSVPDFFSSLHLAGITTLVGLQCAPGVEPLGTEGRPQSPGAPDSSPSRGRGVGCCGLLGVLWLDAGPVAPEATLPVSFLSLLVLCPLSKLLPECRQQVARSAPSVR